MKEVLAGQHGQFEDAPSPKPAIKRRRTGSNSQKKRRDEDDDEEDEAERSNAGVEYSPGGASAATAPRLRRATIMSGKERRAHHDVDVESKSAADDDDNMDERDDLHGPFDSDMDHPSDEEMEMEEGEWQESFRHEEDDEESEDEKDRGGEDEEDRGASFSFSNQPPAGGREQKRMYPAGGLGNMTWEDVSNYTEKQSERDHSNDYQVGTIAYAHTD